MDLGGESIQDLGYNFGRGFLTAALKSESHSPDALEQVHVEQSTGLVALKPHVVVSLMDGQHKCFVLKNLVTKQAIFAWESDFFLFYCSPCTTGLRCHFVRQYCKIVLATIFVGLWFPMVSL